MMEGNSCIVPCTGQVTSGTLCSPLSTPLLEETKTNESILREVRELKSSINGIAKEGVYFGTREE